MVPRRERGDPVGEVRRVSVLPCRLVGQEHAEETLATLQREHTRSQQKMGALLDARAKNVGDVRHQLQAQIDSLKTQLADSQACIAFQDGGGRGGARTHPPECDT